MKCSALPIVLKSKVRKVLSVREKTILSVYIL